MWVTRVVLLAISLKGRFSLPYCSMCALTTSNYKDQQVYYTDGIALETQHDTFYKLTDNLKILKHYCVT